MVFAWTIFHCMRHTCHQRTNYLKHMIWKYGDRNRPSITLPSLKVFRAFLWMSRHLWCHSCRSHTMSHEEGFPRSGFVASIILYGIPPIRDKRCTHKPIWNEQSTSQNNRAAQWVVVDRLHPGITHRALKTKLGRFTLKWFIRVGKPATYWQQTRYSRRIEAAFKYSPESPQSSSASYLTNSSHRRLLWHWRRK